MATHSSTLAWKIPWTRRLVGYSPRDHKEASRAERLHLVPLCQKTKPVGKELGVPLSPGGVVNLRGRG